MTKLVSTTEVSISETPYAEYTEKDWALYFIAVYGGIDGAHHKDWVLDHAARCLLGDVPTIELRVWDNGHKEYSIYLDTDNPPEAYKEWINDIMDGDIENYDPGIAP